MMPCYVVEFKSQVLHTRQYYHLQQTQQNISAPIQSALFTGHQTQKLSEVKHTKNYSS